VNPFDIHPAVKSRAAGEKKSIAVEDIVSLLNEILTENHVHFDTGHRSGEAHCAVEDSINKIKEKLQR
jgi:hypothetical protein